MTNAPESEVEQNGKPSSSGLIYDLEERTAVFSERVIEFALGIERNPVTLPLISQLVDAATSIGANYCEADDADSQKRFSSQNWNMSQGSSRNQILVPPDSPRFPVD